MKHTILIATAFICSALLWIRSYSNADVLAYGNKEYTALTSIRGEIQLHHSYDLWYKPND